VEQLKEYLTGAVFSRIPQIERKSEDLSSDLIYHPRLSVTGALYDSADGGVTAFIRFKSIRHQVQQNLVALPDIVACPITFNDFHFLIREGIVA
jgi:hypothetical protein